MLRIGGKRRENRQFLPPQSTPRLTSLADIFPIQPPFFAFFLHCGAFCPGYFLWFYVSVGVCDRIWSRMPLIEEPVFLWPLWSLKHFSTTKEPFVTKISVDFLFSEISGTEKHVVVSECDDFLVPCYVWRLTLKPIKIRHLWCSGPRVIANQIIFHNFGKITISNGESQTPLLRIFLWGGGVCTQAILKAFAFISLSFLSHIKVDVIRIIIIIQVDINLFK